MIEISARRYLSTLKNDKSLMWAVALTIPFLWMIILQTLAVLGVFKWVPAIKNPTLNDLLLYVLAFSPSYLLLLTLSSTWATRLLSSIIFATVTIVLAPALAYTSMFSFCYLFNKCL